MNIWTIFVVLKTGGRFSFVYCGENTQKTEDFILSFETVLFFYWNLDSASVNTRDLDSAFENGPGLETNHIRPKNVFMGY